jgi:hypothetical protein
MNHMPERGAQPPRTAQPEQGNRRAGARTSQLRSNSDRAGLLPAEAADVLLCPGLPTNPQPAA